MRETHGSAGISDQYPKSLINRAVLVEPLMYCASLALLNLSNSFYVESSGLSESVRCGVTGYVCLSVEFLFPVDL